MKVLARYYPNYVSSRSPQSTAGQDEDYGYYYSDTEQQTHLRDYWNILQKRMRYMVPIFFGTIGLGLIFNLFSPTLYTAKSTLKIEPQNPTVTGVGGVAELREGAGSSQYDYFQTQFAMLQGGPLAARVIKNLGLETNPSFKKVGQPNLLVAGITWVGNSFVSLVDGIINLLKGGAEPRPSRPPNYELGVAPGLVNRYLKAVDVAPVRNTRLVNVTFETPDARLSQQLANAHATEFIQLILENRFNLTQEARDFLGKKLAELREKFQKAEAKLNAFRQEHGVVGLDKGENIIVDRLEDLNRELTKVRAGRIQAETLFQMTRNKNSQYLSDVLSNPVIQQIKTSLANLETEKGRLLSTYTNEHPRIQEINQQIGEARRGLNAEIKNIMQGLEASYSTAAAREQALEAEAKKQQDLALGLKKVGVDYAVLNEEVVVHRSLYEGVLKRLNETNVSNDLAAANIQVMQRAEVPLFPSSPNTKLNLIVSTFLGLLLAIGAAFFLEYMDATVHTPQQVWAAVSLSTLGVIPHLKSLRDRHEGGFLSNGPQRRPVSSRTSDESLSKELVVAQDQISIIAESYRSIRTALMLSQAERPPKVILLTSPCPGDGKTVTTLNLGIALAHSGKKVLAIDADLRRGRCHQLLHLDNRVGLANVLTGHADVKESIQETSIENFYLLARGGLPPNPADLLMAQKMRDILRELRDSFDFIVIDSPPVIAVSDAAVLSAICDGVALVFNGQSTTTASARRALERLDKIGARILGVVLNGIDIRYPDYVDYRSYYPSDYAEARREPD